MNSKIGERGAAYMARLRGLWLVSARRSLPMKVPANRCKWADRENVCVCVCVCVRALGPVAVIEITRTQLVNLFANKLTKFLNPPR